MSQPTPAAQDRDELIRKIAHHVESAAVHLVEVTLILACVAQDLTKLRAAQDGASKEAAE